MPQELGKYGSRVTTITAEQIANAGTDDLAQTLQVLAPGLFISPKNGAFDYVSVSLQGSRTEDILWLVDGVRMNNRLYSSTTPLDTLPAHMVERIEILEGGQGLFYGTQAVAGVVNVVTKAFTDDVQGNFSIGADANDGKHLSGAVSTSRWVFYGSNGKADGYDPVRAQDYQPSALDRERGYDVTTLGGKYAYDFSDAVRFSAAYQRTKADLDYTLPFLNVYQVNSRDEDLLTAKLDVDVTGWASVFLKGYYHKWDTSYDTYFSHLDSSGQVVPGQVDVVNQDAFWGFSDRGVNALLRLAPNKGFEYYLGYDLQIYRGSDEVLLIANRKENTQAVFAQVRTTNDLLSRARLAAGLRYNEPSLGPSATVWNVSGHFDLPHAIFVRSTLGTAFRLPTAYDLFAIDGCCRRGNPELKPVRSEHLNASLGGTWSAGSADFGVELIGFVWEVSDLIAGVQQYDSAGDPTYRLSSNVAGKVKTRGATLALNAAFTPAWALNAAFTVDRTRQDDSDDQFNDIPMQLFKATLDYHPADLPFGIAVTLNYVGKLYQEPLEGRTNIGDYTVVDVSGRWYLDSKRQHRVDARLENAGDKLYATSIDYDIGVEDVSGNEYTYWNIGVPRTLHVSYSYRF